MPSKLKLLIFLLLLVTFLKGIVWSLFIPLWHFPDEQAHFANLAGKAEKKYIPKEERKNKNLLKEIYISEVILGTERDGGGNNKFTYHPEFRLTCATSLDGEKENELKNLPLESRRKTVKYERADYPDFFYNLSSEIYKLVYNSDLFVRVFLVRLFWLPLFVGVVWFSYKIGLIIFDKKYLALLAAILTSFQPMLTFVSSGVTNDNLFNFLYTLIIYFSLKLLADGLKINNLCFLAMTVGLAMKTKPQSYIALSLVIPVLLFIFLKELFKKKKNNFLLIGLIFSFIFLLFLSGGNVQLFAFVKSLENQTMHLPFFDYKIQSNNYSLWDHALWTLRHTIAEVLPWYWGVFRWLSLVLPRWVNRVFMRILLLAFLGLVIKLFSILQKKQFNKKNLLLGVLSYSGLVYFLALLIWDWKFFQSHNFSFGIQGRYYFPAIVAHMILLVVGIKSFFESITAFIFKFIKIKQALKIKIIAKAGQLSLLLLSLWFIFTNLVAFWQITVSYYGNKDIKSFILCASQYKPWFAKGYWLSISLILYCSAVLLFVGLLIRFFCHKSSEN